MNVVEPSGSCSVDARLVVLHITAHRHGEGAREHIP